MKAKNRIAACTFCLLAALALCMPARTDYHYASHDGSNEYPYTSWETAAELIQDAVDAGSRGDTIYVGAGDYHQRVFLETDSLALIGMGMDSTYIWWDGYHEPVIWTDSVKIITDLMIEHTDNYGTSLYGGLFGELTVERCRFEGGGVYVGPRGTINNCIFDGPHSGIFSGFGIKYLFVSNCLITITDNSPIYSRVDTNIVKNNIMSSTDNACIDLVSTQDTVYIANNLVISQYPYEAIFMAPQNSGIVLENNTIDTVSHWHYRLRRGVTINAGSSPTLTIVNNSISGATDYGLVFSGYDRTLFASYNNLWGNDQDFAVDPSTTVDTSGGILHEYPMFDKDNDYRLQTYSPLIDAGDPNILDVDETRSDIGCYGGPGGSGYEYLDLPPLVPIGLSAEVDFEESVIYLNWHYNEETDFNRYQLHRDTVSGFEPSVFNMIGEPDTSFYADMDWSPSHNYYYKVAAVDNQDNMSDYSEELAVILVSIWGQPGVEVPEFTTITSNYPNPFNSQTTIVYHVANIGPVPAEIRIDIYDVLGRKVRTLLNERKEVGNYKVTWDGRDDDGINLPSGVYFARIVQWDQRHLSSKRKLLLVR